MSFGFSATSMYNTLQIDSESPNYACIYSKVLSGVINLRSLHPSDLLVYTHLSGDGGAHIDRRGTGHGSIFLNGNHRVVVFRVSKDIVMSPVPYGMEIYSADGDRVYRSDHYPLVFGQGSYQGMIFQPPGFEEIPASPGVQGLSYSTFCDVNGSVRSNRMVLYVNPDNLIPTGVRYMLQAPAVICRLDDIPLTYTTNNVTGLP